MSAVIDHQTSTSATGRVVGKHTVQNRWAASGIEHSAAIPPTRPICIACRYSKTVKNCRCIGTTTGNDVITVFSPGGFG